MRTAIALALATFALGCPVSASGDLLKRFSSALSEAKANLQTPEGHDYDHALSEFLRKQNAVVLGKCFKSVENPDKNAFEMVFQVATNGAVRDARVWPETNVGVCLTNGLKALTFPVPPRDSYWAHARVSLGP
jgi:hypothetical protein